MNKLKLMLTMLFAVVGMNCAWAGIGYELNRSGYTAYASSACDESGHGGQVECVLDGQTNTYWHSNWSDPGTNNSYGTKDGGCPHFLVIDRGEDTTPLGGFGYIPRQDANVGNGTVKAWKMFVTNDDPLTNITDSKKGVTTESANWTQVATGTYNITTANSNNATVFKTAFDESVNGRYVIFEVTEGKAGYATVAEFYLYADKALTHVWDPTVLVDGTQIVLEARDNKCAGQFFNGASQKTAANALSTACAWTLIDAGNGRFYMKRVGGNGNYLAKTSGETITETSNQEEAETFTITQASPTGGLDNMANTDTNKMLRFTNSSSNFINAQPDGTKPVYRGGGATGGYSVWYVYVLADCITRDYLQEAITTATAKNGATWQGTNPGYYRDLTSAIATAQAVYDLADGNVTQAEVNAAATTLNNAVSNAFVMPETGKYYYIRNNVQGFYNQQGVYKGMYDNEGHNAWATLDVVDFSYLWTWAPKADGWVVRNVGTGKYLNTVDTMSDSEPGGTIKLVFLDAAGEFNIKATGGAVMHANNHGGGSGVASNIISWGGEAGSASSWMLVETTLSEIADLVIADAQAFVDGATIGTQLGQTPQSAINAINAAIATLNGSEKTVESINALKEAVAAAKAQSIWPVFTINSAATGYGAGKSIYEDNPDRQNQNHFKATDLFDYRHLWVFEGLNSTSMAVGTYVIKNAVTGHVLDCGSANPHYTVRHTGDNNNDTESGQWLIYPNETSGSAQQVHAQDAGSVVVAWNSDGSKTAGSGSCWTVSYVSTTAEIAELADALNSYQTILEKDAAAAAMQSSLNPAIGYYSEATAGTVATARAQYAAMDRSTFANIHEASAGFEALISTYNAALAQCSVNLPATGFYRIKGGTSNMYMASTTSSEGRMNIQTLVSDNSENDNSLQTIWCLTDDNTFVSYANGQGIKDTHTLASVGDELNTWSFSAASQGVPYLNVRSNASGMGQYLCDWTDNVANRMGNAESERTHWTIQEVTSLPVTLNAKGFGTLNLPVTVSIPEGVAAWYAESVSDNTVTMKKISGNVLPAGTPVILRGGESANLTFTVTDDATFDGTNQLRGTIAGIANPATEGTKTLVMGVYGDKPGLYNYTGDNIKGFKAYLPYSGSTNVRLVWGDMETAIEAVENSALQEGVMYNLNGQRVQKANGIVIVNGKKYIVK